MITTETALGVLFFVIYFYAIYNFEKLLEIEYYRHKLEWINDGKPSILTVMTTESAWPSGSYASRKLALKWLFKTPKWVINDPIAMSRLKKYRRLLLTLSIILIYTILSIT